MSILNESIREQVKDLFGQQLKQPVGVLFFSTKDDCETCSDTQQLLEEVISLSDKLFLDVHDLEDEAELAQKYHIDKVPGIIFVAKEGGQFIDYGIRILGIPSGHEFSTLIHDLILVSGRDSELEQKTRDELKKLTKPVHLQVFVTPT